MTKSAARLLFTLLLPGLLFAQIPHTPTLDETLSLRPISAARISPDGRFVAYLMRETNWKENTFVSQLWIVNVETEANFQLTRGKESASLAEWSPDGRWIAFITKRESSAIEPLPPEKEAEEKAERKEDKREDAKEGGKFADHQIWVISPEGDEAWQLTKSETDVGNFHWSKDGKWIAFTANPPEAKSGKDRKEKYSDYVVFEKDYQQNQLWLVDVSGAAKNFLPVA